MSAKTCTEVTLACPVEATVLGYYPNLGINIFFAAAFGLCLLGLIGVGAWKRTWGYSIALTAGCALEFAGYLSRVFLHYNPWNQNAFETQICAIILAPTLICISIYLTLKHATLSLNPSLSRIRPRLYPLIFVPADVSCLILQAIGGGLAASAGSDNPAVLLSGDRVIIAGIALQCVVLFFFGAVCVDYYLRVKRWVNGEGEGEAVRQARAVFADKRFGLFCYAVAGAYGAILIRCIYRIAEMAGGWGNYIMQDEPSFIVLEGFMILIAVVLLTAFPPGILFPAMAQREAQRFRRNKGKKSKKSLGSGAGAEKLSAEEPITSSGDESQREQQKTPESLSV
ncbi:Uu.00g052190.m01.CDS01 [Anthostomella pinea]|uniref:Uu.00g052190.m01.CDS01 n=1 Tax=Anthostomella pinea TaxID=933095 RepID=A0AAI8VW71_9PEZI|nr:Uu.00g052190.m01.CDS01 [Anthostomella pinea]